MISLKQNDIFGCIFNWSLLFFLLSIPCAAVENNDDYSSTAKKNVKQQDPVGIIIIVFRSGMVLLNRSAFGGQLYRQVVALHVHCKKYHDYEREES